MKSSLSITRRVPIFHASGSEKRKKKKRALTGVFYTTAVTPGPRWKGIATSDPRSGKQFWQINKWLADASSMQVPSDGDGNQCIECFHKNDEKILGPLTAHYRTKGNKYSKEVYIGQFIVSVGAFCHSKFRIRAYIYLRHRAFLCRQAQCYLRL